MWENYSFLFHMGTYFIMWAPVSSPVSLSHIHTHTHTDTSSPVLLVVKNTPANAVDAETQVRSLDWEDTLEECVATHSNILPGESHGQRSLVGYGPWVTKSWT